MAGTVAASCPFDHSLLHADPDAGPAKVDGDHFEICHQVRDGKSFSRPPVSKTFDVVIVGGGISGMSAAHFLGTKNFLLIEKEDHWGGNAYREEYAHQGFATGSAFDFVGSASAALAHELGLKQLPVNFPDPTIVKGKWVADTWRGGLDELPYSKEIRDGFKKFKERALALKVSSNLDLYDSEPLTKYLAGCPREVAQWWDAWGPSNWGAKAADTSTYVALLDFAGMAGPENHDERITLPGGNGAITKALTANLLAKYSDRMLSSAAAVAVEQQKDSVNVTYFHHGQLKTVAAKAVIMATPKFITALLVSDIPNLQSRAMQAIRYAPYPVINMIFDKPVYNRGFDTWCPGNTFTDFIVADWTVARNDPEYKQKNNILTFYTPLQEEDRHKMLTVEGCQAIAASALHDFKRLLPEFDVDPIEIHFYRRGHPMFMATPGTYSKTIPAARVPLDRVFFANTDSVGPESLASGGVTAAKMGAEWVAKRLAGKSAMQAAAAVGLSV
ncbi:MAG: NAD(P)-binding protein [Phycisphaerae bacterium]|nr:NAD(P)-binding protein [Phycisphaerae bacterium]